MAALSFVDIDRRRPKVAKSPAAGGACGQCRSRTCDLVPSDPSADAFYQASGREWFLVKAGRVARQVAKPRLRP